MRDFVMDRMKRHDEIEEPVSTIVETPYSAAKREFQNKVSKASEANYIKSFRLICNDKILSKKIKNPEDYTFWEMKSLVDKYLTDALQEKLEESLLDRRSQAIQLNLLRNDFENCKGMVQFCMQKKEYFYLIDWLKVWNKLKNKTENEQRTQDAFDEIFKQLLEQVLLEMQQLYVNMSIEDATAQLKKWYVFNKRRHKIYSYVTLKEVNRYLIQSLQYFEEYLCKETAQKIALERLHITRQKTVKEQNEEVKRKAKYFNENVALMQNLDYMNISAWICQDKMLNQGFDNPDVLTFLQKKIIVDVWLTKKQTEQFAKKSWDMKKYNKETSERKKDFFCSRQMVMLCIEKKQYRYLLDWVGAFKRTGIKAKKNVTQVAEIRNIQIELEYIYKQLIKLLEEEALEQYPDMKKLDMKEEIQQCIISYEYRKGSEVYNNLKVTKYELTKSIEELEKYFDLKNVKRITIEQLK